MEPQSEPELKKEIRNTPKRTRKRKQRKQTTIKQNNPPKSERETGAQPTNIPNKMEKTKYVQVILNHKPTIKQSNPQRQTTNAQVEYIQNKNTSSGRPVAGVREA